ncbi:MAG: cell division protein FtsB [Methylococcaceae bacterium]|nr:cell division protein FtsB [Methylococcaceae bacterium]MCI0732995.1 cell division protein FtsB [Methylococcaceae bacterium]
MKLLGGVLIVLLALLQYKFWFGDTGFQKARQYEQRIESLREEIKEIRSRNAALQAEVDDLKNGMAAVEERARRDLGMIRKNETFFQIIEPSAK